MLNNAIFLDRDGTIIVDKCYMHDPSQVELLDGSKEALGYLKDNDWFIFLFSNQSGVGTGRYTIDDVNACNDRMLKLLDLGPGLFKEICIATEAPTDEYIYRKPSPKFILECIDKYNLLRSNCIMVGDKETDVLAGKNAKVKTALISSGKLDYGQTFSCKTLNDLIDKIRGL